MTAEATGMTSLINGTRNEGTRNELPRRAHSPGSSTPNPALQVSAGPGACSTGVSASAPPGVNRK